MRPSMLSHFAMSGACTPWKVISRLPSVSRIMIASSVLSTCQNGTRTATACTWSAWPFIRFATAARSSWRSYFVTITCSFVPALNRHFPARSAWDECRTRVRCRQPSDVRTGVILDAWDHEEGAVGPETCFRRLEWLVLALTVGSSCRSTSGMADSRQSLARSSFTRLRTKSKLC